MTSIIFERIVTSKLTDLGNGDYILELWMIQEEGGERIRARIELRTDPGRGGLDALAKRDIRESVETIRCYLDDIEGAL